MRSTAYIIIIIVTVFLTKAPLFASNMNVYAAVVVVTPPHKVITRVVSEYDRELEQDFYRKYRVYL
ncbi:hypothetical protein BGC07_02445 [Piscirickettsia litoralis]|uniref:Uncharacterized protein n=1 Tax=Piscirickettsia litoralis TaxID=1891921 RepID=A0ABX2ZZK5_9GAMM|nr:hypothetical protein BGC07_02445 [Piscirickettsia litoralis]